MSLANTDLSAYRSRIVVVKVGGEIAEDATLVTGLISDLHKLHSAGIKVVLCHGGGPQISGELKKLGIEPKFVHGLRVTDSLTLEVTCRVLLGEINRKLVAAFSGTSDLAVGLSGLDARLFLCRAKNMELGFVGEVEKVNAGLIKQVLDLGKIPVVASIGIDSDGQCYNINADTAAGALAGALSAVRLIVLTNVDGIYRDFSDKGSLLDRLTHAEAKCLLHEGGLSDGILPKLETLIYAIEHGVGEAQVVNGKIANAVLKSFLKGFGTLVVR